ncbi:fibronectin type-III domain-containing protein 3A isoform X2 [Agrilus planipennis]|uniref:Fibronectin type-III domain-containing protein 3A isoform X2 n=1 Tax=Agrilus planipennis TaxID=224129 RepID=A0A1W4WPL4_AGRPL|nr:fibronectin type-III domain-containing protein 3A isoform X2 [Agrilus planipennis]
MVASQSVAQESQHDMYGCPPSYGEYYPESHFYPVPGSGGGGPHPAAADLCPAHTAICTVHSDFGPVTVPMVSTNPSPPIAMPVQVPPGHVVQQIVDESGTLRHVILSPQHPTGVALPMGGHNPQHYGAGPANGSNQSPQPFYPQSLPPGFPPPHFHSNIPPGAHGPPSSHPSHSPPPPPQPGHGGNGSYYKDERTQRQYNKLKKKLHDKQHLIKTGLDATSTGTNNNNNNNNATTHLLSPRKELINGLQRGAAKEKGMNSVGTSEDGEESSSVQDEEDYVNYITDVLSSVQPPKVSDLNSRSALLQWAVPPRLSETASNDGHELEISESDLRYEVLLSDKSKEMKYKSIYSGASLSCRIQDLRPGQEYSVCLQVHLDELQGTASDPVKFTTPSCEPDQPQPPKLISKSKNSLQLRWNAVSDNGSHILYYILEYDDGKGGDFIELHKSKGKHHTLSKLQSATVYKFRLAAINDIGKSMYSDVVTYATSDNPPTQPMPPSLKEATINSLHLFWQRRPKDDEFVLQMDDPKSRYGYLTVYNGRDSEYTCENLKRFADYKFRLKSQNDGGPSPWSEEVMFRTLPDRPARPSKPVVKGRIHAHSFRLKWEPPSDTGGAEITRYVLELNSGSGYQTVYSGCDTEAICDKLTPGTTYQLRVSCISSGGRSNYSDPCTVTTDAISPGKCSALKLHGKPKTNSVTVRWLEPDYNGGAPVLEYEIEMVGPDSSRNIMHKSKETECTVSGLSPGCTYTLIVRAVNRIGTGPWSEPLTVTSGAAPPDAPGAPLVVSKSPFHVFVEWQEPHHNGAPITEYRLELSHNDSKDHFHPIFQGPNTNHDVKGLTPFTPYFFRVQACNAAGCGEFSPVSATITPAAPPSTVTPYCTDRTPMTITVQWQEPNSNGSPITHYNIEISDQVISTDGPVLKYTLKSLQPDTLYKIKVQAVNGVGVGSLSSSLRVTTAPLPPAAPKLECIGTGHNYLKLKWGEGKNHNFTQYCVEMENSRTKEFQCVYQGTAFTCKVNKLQELTTYRFRVNASNDAGQGDFSEEYLFTTSIAPPAAVKGLKVIDVDQKNCCLEWVPSKNNTSDSVIYSIQVTRLRDQDYKQVYKGSETKCTIDNLEAGAEYCARVCSIRLTSSGELQGPYSSPITFSTPAAEPSLIPKLSVNANAPAHSSRSRNYMKLVWPHLFNTKTMSEQQMVLLGSVFMLVFGIALAAIIMWLFKLK